MIEYVKTIEGDNENDSGSQTEKSLRALNGGSAPSQDGALFSVRKKKK